MTSHFNLELITSYHFQEDIFLFFVQKTVSNNTHVKKAQKIVTFLLNYGI